MEHEQTARERRAAHLKERIYVAFAALAVVLGMMRHQLGPIEAILTLAVTILGLLLAVFTADVVAHLVVHARWMTQPELRHAVRTSFGAMSSLVAPFLFLGAAAIGLLDTWLALLAGAIALIGALVVIGWVAVRRLRLRWWERLLALGAEALLGLAVIGLQVLAHG